MNIVAELLGYLGGLFVAFAFLPQTLHTIQKKDVKGLSLLTYIIYCAGILLWILYGIYLGSVQLILFNSISLLFSGTILCLIIGHRKS